MLRLSLLPHITETVFRDGHAARLLNMAREGAEIYLLVSSRQNGCDGMGERAMIEEEFGDALYALINYCEGKESCTGGAEYDLGCAARELLDICNGEYIPK